MILSLDHSKMSCGFVGGDSWYSVPAGFHFEKAELQIHKNNNENDSADSSEGNNTAKSSSDSSEASIESFENHTEAASPRKIFFSQFIFGCTIPILLGLCIAHLSGILPAEFIGVSYPPLQERPIVEGSIISINVSDMVQILRTFSGLWNGWHDRLHGFGGLHSRIAVSRVQGWRTQAFIRQFDIPLRDDILSSLAVLQRVPETFSLRPELAYQLYQRYLLQFVLEVNKKTKGMILELEKVQKDQGWRHTFGGLIKRRRHYRSSSNSVDGNADNRDTAPFLEPSLLEYKHIYEANFAPVRSQVQFFEEQGRNISTNFTHMQVLIGAVHQPMNISHTHLQQMCKARENYINKYSLPGFGLIKSTLYYLFFNPPGKEDWCIPENREKFDRGFDDLERFSNNTRLALDYLEHTCHILRLIDTQVERLLSMLATPAHRARLRMESKLQDQIDALREAHADLILTTNNAADFAWGDSEDLEI